MEMLLNYSILRNGQVSIAGVPPPQITPDHVFTVVRGAKMDVTEIRKKLVEAIVQNNVVEIANLQSQLSVAHSCYGGASFRNTFKVNQPIDLIALGFFGPWNGKIAKYYVSIDIFESRNNTPDPSIKVSSVRTFTIVDSEVFYIKPLTKIRLEANTWYTVQFCLDEGPSTFRCEKTEGILDVPVGPNGEKVEFVFLSGSMQMPELKFQLPN